MDYHNLFLLQNMKSMLLEIGWEEASSTNSVSHFTFTSMEPKQITAKIYIAAGPGWTAQIEGEHSVSGI